MEKQDYRFASNIEKGKNLNSLNKFKRNLKSSSRAVLEIVAAPCPVNTPSISLENSLLKPRNVQSSSKKVEILVNKKAPWSSSTEQKRSEKGSLFEENFPDLRNASKTSHKSNILRPKVQTKAENSGRESNEGKSKSRSMPSKNRPEGGLGFKGAVTKDARDPYRSILRVKEKLNGHHSEVNSDDEVDFIRSSSTCPISEETVDSPKNLQSLEPFSSRSLFYYEFGKDKNDFTYQPLASKYRPIKFKNLSKRSNQQSPIGPSKPFKNEVYSCTSSNGSDMWNWPWSGLQALNENKENLVSYDEHKY